MMKNIPYMAGVVTRQTSAENPDGKKGGACIWEPDPENPMLVHSCKAVDLGKGWKVRPFVKLLPGETLVMADVDGMGVISEMFFTSNYPRPSELVLRIYWDNEETPSVEVPVGAFFCMGHDDYPHLVNSLPVTVAPERGCNCYWEMPFRKHAKITLTHEGIEEVGIVAYRVLYHLQDVPEEAAYFHAQFRHSLTTVEYPEHVILDGVKGKGVYVGTYLAWNNFCRGWWGEGEVKFYLDGDTEYPTLCDNGTEDYFGGAWGFDYRAGNPDKPEQEFNTPFLGVPLVKTGNMDGCKKFSMYRWHIQDCIGFEEDIKATVQALGWYPGRGVNHKYRPLTEDISSVAYWYQHEPHASFPELPPIQERWER